MITIQHLNKQRFYLFQIYLSQFGYLPASAKNPSSGGLLDEDTWNKAIQEFQAFAGLNVTGKWFTRVLMNELCTFLQCTIEATILTHK